MPEGPEMRRAAAELDAVLRGRRTQVVYFKFPRHRAAARRLEGRKVHGVRARGKALILDFDNGESIYTHNQLYGKWLLGKSGHRPTTGRDLRLAIETASSSALLYSASDIDVLPTEQIEQHPYISKLGVELLDDQTRVEDVAAQIAAPRFGRRSLGALLLDQGFLAGIGNYLRSEILFVAGLDPERRIASLSGAERAALAEASLEITRRAYHTGGITNDLTVAQRMKRQGHRYREYRHHVFDRPDQPCHRCGTGVQRIVHSGRQLYRCTHCQSAGVHA